MDIGADPRSRPVVLVLNRTENVASEKTVWRKTIQRDEWVQTDKNGCVGVGGLLGWFWESPEVAAYEGERFRWPVVARNPVNRNSDAKISLPAQSAANTLDRIRVDEYLPTKNWEVWRR